MSPSNRNNSGFTLIEVLVGLAITAALMGLLLAAMRMGYRSEEKSQERSEVSQRLRIVNDRIEWLLTGTFPFIIEGEGDEEDFLLFNGDATSIEFVTSATDPYSEEFMDTIGLKWVKLYVTEEGLMMASRVFYDEDAEEKVRPLDPTVESIAFEYLNYDRDLGSSTWLTSWVSQEVTHLPMAVKATVTLTYKDDKFKLPPVIAAIRTSGVEVENKSSSGTQDDTQQETDQ